MTSKVKIEIELGNDAMRKRRDLHLTVLGLAWKLLMPGWMGCVIADDNGNTVGRCRIILDKEFKKENPGW